MTVGAINNYKGGNVTIFPDLHIRSFGVHLGETTNIGSLSDLWIAVDPNKRMIGIVLIVYYPT